VSPGGLLIDRRKQEVVGRSARELHAGACLVEEETKGVFAHSPWILGKSRRFLKLHIFGKIL
jgi:hypothetical protein